MVIKQNLSIVLLAIGTLLTFLCNDAQAINEEAPLLKINADLTTGLDCITIQQCIDKANPSDTILITAGTYFENLILDKNLTLQGAGEAITIIDGKAINSVITINNHVTATITNVTITNGISGIRNGGTLKLNYSTINQNTNGGISNWHDDSALTIKNCSVKNNSIIGVGGGIYNGGGKLTIINSIIEGNSASRVGGGIFAEFKSKAILKNTIISNNISDLGGGIYHDADDFKLINSSIINNIASQGGGIYNDQHTQIQLENTLIKGNSATANGGGIYSFTDNKVTLVSSTVEGNTASKDGGGIYSAEGRDYGNEVNLKSSMVIGNLAGGKGSGVFNDINSTIELANSTINDNDGSGLHNNGELILQDSGNNNVTHIGSWGTVVLTYEETNSNNNFEGEASDSEDLVILHNKNTVHNNRFGIYSKEITTLVKSEVNRNDLIDTASYTNLEVIDSVISENISNINSEVSLTVKPSIPNLIYVSSSSSGKVENISFNKEDILVYNLSTKTWSLYFDGSDVGLSSADLNAFHLQNDGSLLLSLQEKSFAIPNFDTVKASDIVRFLPTSLGKTTQGNFEWYFDGSDVGLSNAEGIDAIGFTIEGDLLVSIIVGFQAKDIAGTDKDLYIFKASSLGQNTTGNWSLYFDGSDINLNGPTEDVYGAWLNPNNGDLYQFQ